ncbi:protein of unknown function [Pseudodesulfovibrio piezophilus C1TLV30]|uniref:Uncharacterized protein n=1 Tax=Pseudodesulfovibrio piezophilus (strain DSM 21447 / JCM 15486 / C1TLV30) TaxID=1322246 RepID=M1WUV1_PSEP2|nr:protein of unknown function [Pseudodesulfovibrio piezophilus C1TLV30]
MILFYGGEGGIRTPGRVAPPLVFKTSALNRALPPLRELIVICYNRIREKLCRSDSKNCQDENHVKCLGV